MPRDLLEGAAPASGAPRDLFAESGVKPPQDQQVQRYSHLGPLNAPANSLEGFTEQMQRSMTFGLSDKVGALAKAIPSLWGGNDGQGFGDAYHAELANERGAGQKYSEDHPIASPIATTIGAANSMGPLTKFATTLPGMAGQGAVMGGLSGFGNSNDESPWRTLLSTAVGSGTGAGINAAAGLAARALFPNLSPEVRKLADANVKMSPGQVTGTGADELVGKLPIANSMANSAQRQSVNSFARETVNKTLAPIGEKLGEATPAGHQAVAEAAEKIGDVFNRVAKTGNIAVNPAADFAVARAQVPSSLQPDFDKIIQQNVTGRIKNGVMDGAGWKAAKDKLGDMAERYLGGNAQEQFMGDALEHAQDALHAALARSNPMEAAALNGAREAWGLYSRVARTARSVEAMKNGGVFTPEQLLSTVGTMGKGAASKGRALLQDWAKAGYDVIGRGRPMASMGIKDALLSSGVLAGGGFGLGGPAGAAAGAAAIPAASAAGALAYSPLVRNALTNFSTRSGYLFPHGSAALNQAGPYLASQAAARQVPGLMGAYQQ